MKRTKQDQRRFDRDPLDRKAKAAFKARKRGNDPRQSHQQHHAA